MLRRVTHLALCAALCAALGTACRDSRHQATAAGDVSESTKRQSLAQDVAGNAVLRRADSALAARHPWRATVVLAPVLRDPKQRTPAALLLAARAAAGWQGWVEVDRLLAREPWIDSAFGGEARELLARAALDRDAD